MSEQPNGPAQDPQEDQAQDVTAPQPPSAHGHVRTEGETRVDDALGAADDPR